MGVRAICSKGKLVGYQAIGGAGQAGASSYFSVAKHGPERAFALATKAAESLALARPARIYRAAGRNASGLPGLRLEYRESKARDGVPVLYAVASWEHKGGNRQTGYSTQKHGLLGAVELAKAKREKGLGVLLGLTARQVLNRMKLAL